MEKTGCQPVENMQQGHGISPSGQGHEEMIALDAHGVPFNGVLDLLNESCLCESSHEAGSCL